MKQWSRRLPARLPVAIAVASIAALAGSVPTLAAGMTAGATVRVGDHPFTSPGCDQSLVTPGTLQPGTVNVGAEVEPYVTVDRSSVDPVTGVAQNVIGVFQQDRWSNGGAHGLVTAVSHDGGATWPVVTFAPFDACTGGPGLERSSDPWVSISPNGNAYQIAISFDVSGPGFGGPNGVFVSKSTDHGNTWGAATALKVDQSSTVLNDKESITADPNTSNNVYAVWDRLVSPSVNASPTGFEHALGFRGPAWFARTTNGGASWEPARIIFDPGQENQTIGNQIVVRPSAVGGQLVDGFNLIANFKNAKGIRGFNVAVLLSADQGATWSGPVIVDKMNFAPVVIPATGAAVRTGDIIPEFAVDRTNGTVYAVWQDSRFTGHSNVAFSQSTDGGRTWSPTIRVDQATGANQAFTPMVHVAGDGTIGVSYYEMVTAAGGTNTVMVHCHPGATVSCANAANWATNGATLVAGPYDMTTAPQANGFFVGDYEGLTDFGQHGFRPFFIQAQPQATAGKTDPFTAAVCPSSGC
jgi:hypothetical protein